MESYEYYTEKALVGVRGFAPFDMTCCSRMKCMNAGWGGFTGLYVTEELKAGKITVARLFSEDGGLKMLMLTADLDSFIQAASQDYRRSKTCRRNRTFGIQPAFAVQKPDGTEINYYQPLGGKKSFGKDSLYIFY